MTIEDALKSNPVFAYVPDDVIELACINRSVEMTDDYSISRLKDLELISADLYMVIVLTPEFREGGLDVKYNTEDLKLRASNIYLKHGDDKLSDTGFRNVDLGITKLGAE